ncbi:MAG TPA: hypothetical protein PKV71_09660, partial [Calditrichia bacterium]|nr:hypothetical protein [Calditrichia bacterium]
MSWRAGMPIFLVRRYRCSYLLSDFLLHGYSAAPNGFSEKRIAKSDRQTANGAMATWLHGYSAAPNGFSEKRIAKS